MYSFQIHDLMQNSGTNGTSLWCNTEMKIPFERCFESNGVFLQAIARHTLFYPSVLMQKDQRLSIDKANNKLKQAGVPDDEMAALERQLAPAVNDTPSKDSNRKVGFVSAGIESQTDGGIKVTANHEDIELLEDGHSEDLANKRKDTEDDEGGDGESRLGALEIIKRQKKKSVINEGFDALDIETILYSDFLLIPLLYLHLNI